jgi:thiol-disulfide isomerase/thioredoxin
MSKPRAVLLSLALGLFAPALAAGPLATDFNDAAFDWYGHEEGLAKAEAEGKRVFLLVKTDWCPHCKTYREAFQHPRVTARAGDYVFVMLDRDVDEAITSTIAPDGDYVPRTMILSAEGKVVENLAPHWVGAYRYFVYRPYPDELASFLDWVATQPEAKIDG